jgi:prephenate dehydrogenase
MFCLTPSAKADPEAVKLVADLVTILGASPLFLDPGEHDGLMAAVDHLPTVVSLALMGAVSQQSAWRELRKVAGASFEIGTQLSSSASPKANADLCLANRENILRWIDTFSAALASIRRGLAEENSDDVLKRFADAAQQRDLWLRDRATGSWEEQPVLDTPRSNVFADAFLGSWWRNRRRKDD